MAHLNSKNKQYDLPVRRTLKGGKGKGDSGPSPSGKGKGDSGPTPSGPGKGGSGKGGSGKGGTCSDSNAESCVSDPGLPDTACKESVDSDIDDTGACVGLDFGRRKYGVCEDMNSVTVDQYSCVDQGACTFAAFTEICESSCQGTRACYSANNSAGDETHILTIGPGSCRSGPDTCYSVQNVERIGSGSCIYDSACYRMYGESPDDRTTVGENSCVGDQSCRGFSGKSIGDNACVGNSICKSCTEDVLAGKCNEDNGNTDCLNCPCACGILA